MGWMDGWMDGWVLYVLHAFQTLNTKYNMNTRVPSRELTYPPLGKEKSSSKCHFGGI